MNPNAPDDRTADRPLLLRMADALVWAGGALSALLILLAFGFTIVAVFWRYVLSSPLLWPNDLTGWTLVALIMLGTAEAYRRDNHIAIDLLTARLQGGTRRLQLIWSHLAVLGFSAILVASAWHSVHFAYDWRAYTSGTIEIPLWIPQAPLLIGAGLLGLTAVTKLIETILSEVPS